MYLSLLEVPKGYETEVLTIEKAASIASGYNEGKNASDAKYKIYIHQDLFIIEKQFLKKLLRIFQKDAQIGMVGMIGAEHLSKDAVMWHEDRCGDFYRLEEMLKAGLDGIEHLKSGVREVEVIDGLFMATQYDLPWREDILKGWDFYDVSQCMEFRRAGYKIVVPAQRPSWTIHACGMPTFWNYETNRQIILREYPEITEGGRQRLHILYYNSEQIQLLGLAYSLTGMGHNVNISPKQVSLATVIPSEIEGIEEELEEGHYDLVVTYDFSFNVSKACENMKVKYYAWTYDSPLLGLYSEYAKSPYTYISVFDKKQYERMREFGIQNLYHIPLCADVEVFGSTNITKRDEKKYETDVSFVGRLYDKRGYEELFSEDSLKLKQEFDAIAESGGCRWNGDSPIFGRASEKLVDYICSKEPEMTWQLCLIDKQYFCDSMKLVRRCNELERIAILNKLAEKHKVVLYSDDSPKEMLRNVKVKPWVDYWAEMPKVFHLSRINLNITSRSIESGIPQRVWDIMAVGGFCLTNYQPEIEDYFTPGVDLEIYHDLDELCAKVDYYLKHEDKRIRIAMNGYQKVRKHHTYEERLEKILGFIFPEIEQG